MLMVLNDACLQTALIHHFDSNVQCRQTNTVWKHSLAIRTVWQTDTVWKHSFTIRTVWQTDTVWKTQPHDPYRLTSYYGLKTASRFVRFDKLIRSENAASRSVHFSVRTQSVNCISLRGLRIFPHIIWEWGLYGLTIRTVRTDRKGTFRSVNCISLRRLGMFPRLIWERGLYGLTIRTVCTDRKGTFRSVYGP